MCLPVSNNNSHLFKYQYSSSDIGCPVWLYNRLCGTVFWNHLSSNSSKVKKNALAHQTKQINILNIIKKDNVAHIEWLKMAFKFERHCRRVIKDLVIRRALQLRPSNSQLSQGAQEKVCCGKWWQHILMSSANTNSHQSTTIPLLSDHPGGYKSRLSSNGWISSANSLSGSLWWLRYIVDEQVEWEWAKMRTLRNTRCCHGLPGCRRGKPHSSL